MVLRAVALGEHHQGVQVGEHHRVGPRAQLLVGPKALLAIPLHPAGPVAVLGTCQAAPMVPVQPVQVEQGEAQPQHFLWIPVVQSVMDLEAEVQQGFQFRYPHYHMAPKGLLSKGKEVHLGVLVAEEAWVHQGVRQASSLSMVTVARARLAAEWHSHSQVVTRRPGVQVEVLQELVVAHLAKVMLPRGRVNLGWSQQGPVESMALALRKGNLRTRAKERVGLLAVLAQVVKLPEERWMVSTELRVLQAASGQVAKHRAVVVPLAEVVLRAVVVLQAMEAHLALEASLGAQERLVVLWNFLARQWLEVHQAMAASRMCQAHLVVLWYLERKIQEEVVQHLEVLGLGKNQKLQAVVQVVE